MDRQLKVNKTLEISSRRASFFNSDKESRLNRDRRPRVPASTHNLRQVATTLARRRLGLKSHSRSSPVTGGLVIGACLQVTRAARESFRTSGIHKYSGCPADSANGGG